MNWEKYTWNDGDQITAQKLNHLEYGISRSEENSESFVALIVHERVLNHADDYSWVKSELDKDYNTIYTSLTSGIPIILKTFDDLYYPLIGIQYQSESESFINPAYSYLDTDYVEGIVFAFARKDYSKNNIWLRFSYAKESSSSLYPYAEYELVSTY